MKKSILTLAFLSFILLVTAQTEKGTFLFAGSSGLNFLSGNSKIMYDGETMYQYNSNTFEIIPSFGYFIQDNLAIGLMSSISLQTYKDEDGDKSVSNTTMLVPSVFYFFPMEGKLRPYAQLGAGYSSSVSKWIPKTGSNDKTSYGGLVINGGAGVAYFIKEHIAIDAGLSYTKEKLKDLDDDSDETRSNMFGANFGISFFLN